MTMLDSLGQWLTMPIRYTDDNQFHVLYGEEVISAPTHRELTTFLSHKTLEGGFADLQSKQRELAKKKERD